MYLQSDTDYMCNPGDPTKCHHPLKKKGPLCNLSPFVVHFVFIVVFFQNSLAGLAWKGDFNLSDFYLVK